jgi:regulation of enolase protein 1 (concanavalin A-like superfamily)
MNLREFMRFHLLKALLIFVGIQIGIVAFIQSYNHRPQAISDHVSMIEGRSVKITPLSNDFDKDQGDELVILNVKTPGHGSVNQKGNLLSYIPAREFSGVDSFIYTISDGNKVSKDSWITIQVNKNLKPVASRDIAEVYCEGRTIIDVLKNDKDREGDSIIIKGFSKPTYGHLNLVENQIVYISDVSSAQTDSFLYVINDGKNNSDSSAVIIKVRSKNDPCYPWLSCDVGDAVLPGSFNCVKGAFIIEASGSDIWNNTDGFRYAYQYINGDCEIYSKIESLEGNHEWAKAGIMARESLNGDSKNAIVCITNRNGVTCQQRYKTNDAAEAGKRIPDVKTPYWIKLIRKGNTFSYYVSPDGTKWELFENADVPMERNVYIGFAVTSHNNSEISKAVFSNYSLSGKVAK